MSSRDYTALDHLIMGFENIISVIDAKDHSPSPGKNAPDLPDKELERQRSAALMRVNHAGEVAAQALYAGHAVMTRDQQTRDSMLQAAKEERDHLAWCEARVRELDSHISYLTPVWYFGSFVIGAVAASAGDKWSLGFVMETERQVVEHLDEHLQRLPEQDRKSRFILEQMRRDELRHGAVARDSGGVELPLPARVLMRCCAKVMTGVAYWL